MNDFQTTRRSFEPGSNKSLFFMFVGLPASGKTTYSHLISNLVGGVIVSSDKIKETLFGNNKYDLPTIFNEQEKILIDLCKTGCNIIVDSNCDKQWIRDKHQKLAISYGYRPIIIELVCPLDVLRHRLSSRRRLKLKTNKTYVHEVDDLKLEEYSFRLEKPSESFIVQTDLPFKTSSDQLIGYLQHIGLVPNHESLGTCDMKYDSAH